MQLPVLNELFSGSAASLLFACTAGSRAYGTATASSDVDVRGIFALPAANYLMLMRPPDQIADERGNLVYYALRRTIELLGQANPNILELLYMPQDCVRITTPEMQNLEAHRQVFITKQCADTHAGYAMAQIKKARGQNKWVNNPKPVEAPCREDFCFIIPWSSKEDAAPARPVPLRASGWSLSEYHAARLEHVREVYRLYHYGSEARGVFRGDVLVCESIPRDDESRRFAGLLVFNEAGWQQALSDHRNYWTWRRERNDARWQQQERGEVDFDAKNMMHTVRLLLSGRSILASGAPIVRFTGEPLALLMAIREAKLTFNEILELSQDILDECQRLKATADLPDVCELTQASALLAEITHQWEERQP
jgi:predicted nucleotidyltransferase